MEPSTEQQERYISIWAKAVETQMHFNEMSVKSRQLGLTFVAAALGVGMVLITRGDDFAIILDLRYFELRLHVAVLLILSAALAVKAVRGLDLNVYHKMLRGAVKFGEDFEQHYMKSIFGDLEKGMTQAISHFSQFSDAKTEVAESGTYTYKGTCKETAEYKINKFYKTVIRFLFVAAAALFIFTNLGIIRPVEDPIHRSQPTKQQSAEDIRDLPATAALSDTSVGEEGHIKADLDSTNGRARESRR